jgi:hypothetical protein
MRKHATTMNEVVGIQFQFIMQQVVTTYFNVCRQVYEEPRVEVRDDDSASGPDTVSQPAGNRSAATTNFETAPARRDPNAFEMTKGPRIHGPFKGAQACAFDVI